MIVSTYFLFLFIAAWIFLPLWALHHLGIDMIDYVKAKASGDAGRLIGRKAREQLGLALWSVARRIAVLQRQEKIEAKISLTFEIVTPENAILLIKEKATSDDIEDIARAVLASTKSTLTISIRIEVMAFANSPNSAEALKKAGTSFQELRYMVLANIPFQKLSRVSIESRGWITSY